MFYTFTCRPLHFMLLMSQFTFIYIVYAFAKYYSYGYFYHFYQNPNTYIQLPQIIHSWKASVRSE